MTERTVRTWQPGALALVVWLLLSCPKVRLTVVGRDGADAQRFQRDVAAELERLA